MNKILEVEVIRIFEKLEDPRVDRTKKHNLIDIIGTTIMGALCGMQNWVEIVEWSNNNLIWLKKWFELPNGIPSHDTYGTVFAKIDSEALQNKFKEWIDFLNDNFPRNTIVGKEVVALDGKALRGSKVKKKVSTNL